jgi:uncharacterized protein
MNKVLILVLLTVMLCPPLFAQQPFDGRWEGAIAITGIELQIVVTFTSTGNAISGTIDIPQQGAAGLPLTNITASIPKIHFELQAGPGIALFDGILNNGSIKGDFSQAGVKGTFALKSITVEPEKIPYKQEEVIFYNGDIHLAGTLTLPADPGPFPAVVMITGSGPQNRDEELLGLKPFKIISDYFTRHRIAVLRYDDRGVGGSTGNINESTSEDFAGDVIQAVKYLQGRSEINHKKIGLCGHSEGGLIAPMVASRMHDIAFIIMISGPGVEGHEILTEQLRLIMRADGVSVPDIEKQIAVQKEILTAVIAHAPASELKERIRTLAKEQIESLRPEQKKAIGNIDQYVEKIIDAKLAAVQSRWFRFFIAYDPATALEKVHCPVLAIFGERDLQVPADLNKAKIEAALQRAGNSDVTTKIFPQANHLFQSAGTGSPSEYGQLKKEFVPGFLDTMTEWILKRVR